MNAREIKVEVVVPEPSAEFVASIELLISDLREYSGLCLAARVVARELLEFSFGSAAEQIIRIGTLSKLLCLESTVVLRALRELEARRLIVLDLHDIPPLRRTCPGRWAKVPVYS